MRPLHGDSDSIKNLQHKTELLPWSQEPTPQSESDGKIITSGSRTIPTQLNLS